MATRKPRAENQATTTYTVHSPLDHDGERYAAGDSIELTDDQAKPLLELGVVKPAPAAT